MSQTPSAEIELARRSEREARALAALTFAELRRGVGGVAGVHQAIAARAFGASGPGARPARAVHDRIAGGVYAAIGAGAGVAERVVPPLVSRHPRVRERPLTETKLGAGLVGAVNGLIGDALEADGSPLAQPLSLRVDGRPVAPRADALARAFPRPTSRLVVFVHGLMETEHAWRTGDEEPYAVRLRRDLGTTALELRVNTGRHVSENGRSLADLLEAVVAAWPVEVTQVALVGHSMGGLIARSACHQAAAGERAWVTKVRHVVSLGSPHLGAPLAQGVHLAAHALHRVPETRPFGAFLRRRSAGIRDLRHGSLVDEDWRDLDPDELRAAALAEVPLLEGATHHFVAACVTRSPRHPVGRLVGDWLVLGPSASGRSRTRRIGFAAEHGLELGGTHHLALLNHPAVYERLRAWLGSTPSPRGHTPPMSPSDQVGGGEASLGDAQSSHPPADPEMITQEPDLDTDVDFEGEDAPEPELRGNEDPSPNAP